MNDTAVIAPLPWAPRSFQDLPNSLITHIISFLPFNRLLRFSTVDHKIYSLCRPRLKEKLTIEVPLMSYLTTSSIRRRLDRIALLRKVASGRGTPFENALVGLDCVLKLKLNWNIDEERDGWWWTGFDIFQPSMDILQAVSARLETLWIIRAVSDDRFHDNHMHLLFKMPQLRSLKLEVSREEVGRSMFLRKLLNSASSLDNLKIHELDGTSERGEFAIGTMNEEAISSPSVASLPTMPKLPNLASIGWHRTESNLKDPMEVLQEIVAQSPALVSITARNFLLYPTRPILEHKTLKRLIWIGIEKEFADWRSVYKDGDLCSLEYHMINHARGSGHGVELGPGVLLDIAKTPYPLVDHLAVFLPYNGRRDLGEYPQYLREPPPSVWSIDPNFLEALRDMPKLDHVEAHCEGNDSERHWESSVCSYYIRTFINGNDGHTLVHIDFEAPEYEDVVHREDEAEYPRTETEVELESIFPGCLTEEEGDHESRAGNSIRTDSDDEDRPEDCAYRRTDGITMLEATDYRGKKVPSETLSEVYRIAEAAGFVTDGGRDKELPDACWEVLEDWFAEGNFEEEDSWSGIDYDDY